MSIQENDDDIWNEAIIKFPEETELINTTRELCKFCDEDGKRRALTRLFEEIWLRRFRRRPPPRLELRERELGDIEDALRKDNVFVTLNPDPEKIKGVDDIIDFEDNVLCAFLRCKWVSYIGPVFREQAPETGRYHWHMVIRTSRYKSPAEIQRYWIQKKCAKGWFGNEKHIYVLKVSNHDVLNRVDAYCRKDGSKVELPKDLHPKVVEDVTEHFDELPEKA